jgi:aminomethyltransferase
MPFGYRLVTNAATEAKDLNWIKQIATGFKVELFSRRDLAMLAVQGPNAIAKVIQVQSHLAERLLELPPFMSLEDNGWFYARTGYTGEDGLEIMLPRDGANAFWKLLHENGVAPCGLGSRDTLRLEAGMNLYGHEMDETITPVECGMDWVVDLSDETRDFMGKKAYQLAKISSESARQRGLVLEGKGILRDGQKVFVDGVECGIVTSGTFSPSLRVSLGMARIKSDAEVSLVEVEIRGKLEAARVVSLPFVRNGKKMFK